MEYPVLDKWTILSCVMPLKTDLDLDVLWQRIRGKFRQRKKQKGETYAHMAEDLRRLARRIYRKDTKLAEQEAKEQFLRWIT